MVSTKREVGNGRRRPVSSPTMPTTEGLTRGHKKKARTRQLLVDTAFEVLAEHGEGFNVVDIAARAGVSHGTFYNYFADRDVLLSAMVAHSVERFASRLAVEVEVSDPAARFAQISAKALEAAVVDPLTTRVILRVDVVQRGLMANAAVAHLRRDLSDGYASGRFTSPPDQSLLDVVLGSLFFAARRILDGHNEPTYPQSVIRCLLQTLGVEASEAEQLAAEAVGQSTLTT